MKAYRIAFLLPVFVLLAFLGAACFMSHEPLDTDQDLTEERETSLPQQPVVPPPATEDSGSDVEEPHERRISGPYAYRNLGIFLIHGKDRIDAENIMTLSEALGRGLVVVHETGNVSRLAIENVSDMEIFIQAGEMVKGGKQDRVLAVDLILSPNSGRIPISSFCVEQGRWQGRTGEEERKFRLANLLVASHALKQAVQLKKSQGDVWEEVERLQRNLPIAVREQMARKTSQTSLQENMELDVLEEAVQGYINVLTPHVEREKDVIGYIYSINGRIVSGDLYAASSLFRKMWPKLIRANATEALVLDREEKPPAPPTKKAVMLFLVSADSGAESRRIVTGRTRLVGREARDSSLVEARDSLRDAWVHRCYLAKTDLSKMYLRRIREVAKISIEDLAVTSVPAISGEVTSLNNRLNLVVINVGEKDGVHVGFQFTVYRGREYVAKLVVEKVYPKKSAGRVIEMTTKDKVLVGDKVATKIY
jgi:hypothetical protein